MALLRFWRIARSPRNASNLPPSQRGADTLSRRALSNSEAPLLPPRATRRIGGKRARSLPVLFTVFLSGLRCRVRCQPLIMSTLRQVDRGR